MTDYIFNCHRCGEPVLSTEYIEHLDEKHRTDSDDSDDDPIPKAWEAYKG